MDTKKTLNFVPGLTKSMEGYKPKPGRKGKKKEEMQEKMTSYKKPNPPFLPETESAPAYYDAKLTMKRRGMKSKK